MHSSESIARCYVGKMNEVLAQEGRPAAGFDVLSAAEQKAHLMAADWIMELLPPQAALAAAASGLQNESAITPETPILKKRRR